MALLVSWLGLGPLARAQQPVVRPYETEGTASAVSAIDDLVLARLRARGIVPAHPCSDEVFVRRVYLDVIGTLPTVGQVREFLGDSSLNRRRVLIDQLLERREFSDYWSLKWGDLLRIKSEFPINLWPNAVQAYHRWVHDALRQHWGYDRFVRELLTSSGSNYRMPATNFYRAVQGRTPAAIADAVALTFMGTRLAGWPAARRDELGRFFSRIQFKPTSEWKEEIVLVDPAPHPALAAVLPDGTRITLAPDQDPREVFANWLITGENKWFSRNIVNRIWCWLMGRGLVHEPDDIREDNPASHPDVLAHLEDELKRAHFDLRHIFRLILNSRTYQQSSIPQTSTSEATGLGAHYVVRLLDAEVLSDAIRDITGVGENYSSAIPEPFTFIPENLPTILLSDGSITDPFLKMFGRPNRDTGLESERKNQPTEAQRLHLLNSTHVQRKITGSRRLRDLAQSVGRNAPEIVRVFYLSVLSRNPTADELGAVLEYLKTSHIGPRQVGVDLVWALFNTKEFLYRH